MTLDLLEVDPVTGEKTTLASSVRAALRSLNAAEVPYAVIGATALAVRGLPRMTRDLDVVVLPEDAFIALTALEDAGFHSITPVNREDDPEPMYTMRRGADEVDLLVASAEPESTVVAEATSTLVFGTKAPVATLEHLVLMYLYSNQIRHHGDLARIITDSDVDLAAVERYLADVHPEMLSVLKERVGSARVRPEAPKRPTRRRK